MSFIPSPCSDSNSRLRRRDTPAAPAGYSRYPFVCCVVPSVFLILFTQIYPGVDVDETKRIQTVILGLIVLDIIQNSRINKISQSYAMMLADISSYKLIVTIDSDAESDDEDGNDEQQENRRSNQPDSDRKYEIKNSFLIVTSC